VARAGARVRIFNGGASLLYSLSSCTETDLITRACTRILREYESVRVGLSVAVGRAGEGEQQVTDERCNGNLIPSSYRLEFATVNFRFDFADEYYR